MAKKPVNLPPLEADKLYKISFSRRFEHGGRTYVPRANVTVKLIGSAVEEIKDKLDSYELVKPVQAG